MSFSKEMVCLSDVADDMFIIDFGQGDRANGTVGCFWEVLAKQALPAWLHPVAGVTTMGFIVDELVTNQVQLKHLKQWLLKLAKSTVHKDLKPTRKLVLPVCYDAGMGMDLTRIANEHGLKVEEVVEIHLSGIYRAELIGFLPGFAYLGGVDSRIQTPRLSTPRSTLPPGSLGIAGSQCAIYPDASPGGWNIIGRCPFKLFDVAKAHPCFIQLSDMVTFQRITKSEFDQLWTQR